MATENVFNSSSAIRDINQKLFVGRGESLSQAYIDLKKTGAIVAVYGERGVGKSSFVWQLLKILTGKTELIDLFGLNIPFDRGQKCVYIECSSDLEDLTGLLRKLIFRKTIDNNAISELSLIELYHDVNAKKSLVSDIPDQVDDSEIIDLFFKITRHIVRESQQEIIICIDEFERLPSKRNLGDFFKLLQTTREDSSVKYIISGVAKSHRELVADHASIPRKLKPIILDRLGQETVSVFFNNAESLFSGLRIKFDRTFVEKTFEFSNGYPPLMQLIGESFVDLLLLRKIQIRDDDLNVLTSDVFDNFHSDIAQSEEIKRADDFAKLRREINKPGKVALIKKFLNTPNLYIEKKLLSDDSTKYGFIPNMQSLIDGEIFEEHEINNNLIKFRDPYFRFVLKSEIALNKDISRGRVK